MADNEEREEATSRINGWEVVSLTSSAYAAGPGPEPVDANDDIAQRIEKDQAMFMSGHFVFPPSQHENLPLEMEEVEAQNVPKTSVSSSRLDTRDFLHELGEVTFLPGAHIIEKEQSMITDSKCGFFYSDENTFITGQMESSEEHLDSEMLHLSSSTEEDGYNSSKLPSEAWWKRRATTLSTRAKEANTFWTIFVAATVMGIVIVGKCLHREKLEILHLKGRLSLNSENVKKLLGPIFWYTHGGSSTGQ